MHSKPITSTDAKQRLSLHHQEWTLDRVNDFADGAAVVDREISSLLYNELREGHEVTLIAPRELRHRPT
ncbi:hypothetical protein WDZ92_32280 [Nostoc sp. NIES-2111]